MTETTFATPIDEAPCEHDWYYKSGNWAGIDYVCLYCKETKWVKSELRMTNLQIGV